MHNITKDIFYLIGTFLEVNDFRHMGSVNKKFFNFYRLTVEQTVLEKTGNANKIAALLHNAPEGLAWREQFTAEKGPKNNTLKTVLSSNILDRIKLYKTPILENPYRSIKLMLKYTAPEIFTAICKDFCIETELKKMLQMIGRQYGT
jgi:hypothetical protein